MAQGQYGQGLVTQTSRTTIFTAQRPILRETSQVRSTSHGHKGGTTSWAIGLLQAKGCNNHWSSSWAKGRTTVIVGKKVSWAKVAGHCTKSNANAWYHMYHMALGQYGQKLVARHHGPLAIIHMVWKTKAQRPTWEKIGREGIADQGNCILRITMVKGHVGQR